MMMQIEDALKQARQRLQHSETPQLDAEILLCHCLDCDRSRVYAWPEEELPADIDAAFFELVEKRAAGHPVAHLIASREFWSLRLKVTQATLIPRPETECLVEAGLAMLPADKPCTVLDLGTGSGAIAIAIATERPCAHIVATDISAAALAVAQYNAARHQLHDLRFIHADWFNFKNETNFDMIISNPPYISPEDEHLQQGDVRFEARTALVAEEEGLAHIHTIIANARRYLNIGGWLLLEHGYQQANKVQTRLKQHGFSQVKTGMDLSGHERYSIGQYQT